MNPKRVSTALLAALLPLAACAPARPAPVAAPAPTAMPAPAPAPAVEVLGEPVTPVAATVHAAKRDILGGATYDLPVEANSWVEAELDFLVGQRREVIALWLARGEPYEGFIKGVLKSYGVPTDLYHLAMIESGFLPAARSHAGAVGLWQFMPGTARALGLRVDSLVDERVDPVRSTRAAARHLRSLRAEMGDWALAAAAYNAGTGRISRGLKGFGATDFWDLAQRGDLAAETRRYVPRLFAMTIIGRGRERFGFKPASSGSQLAFDSIQVEFATPFEELAKLGAKEEQLARLNPHLVNRRTPPDGYWVWVPAGKGVAMQRAWLASDFRREQGYGSYAVRKGDTLGDLADLSDVRASRIRELNPGVDFDNLQIGEKLRLPYRVAKQLSARPVRERSESVEKKRASSETSSKETEDKPRSTATHTVGDGESLWSIARKHGTSVAELQKANGLASADLRPGQELRIPGGKAESKGAAAKARPAAPEPARHVVKSGESLWAIARQYNSSVEAIQEANDIADRPIQPGQRLTIPRAE